MDSKQFVFKSSLVILSAEITSKILGYIWLWYIAKLGPEILGFVSLSLGIHAIYFLIVFAGLKKGLIRNIKKTYEDLGMKKIESIYSTLISLTLLTNLIGLIIVIILGKSISLLIYKTAEFYISFLLVAVASLIVSPIWVLSIHGWISKRITFITFSSQTLVSVLKLLFLFVGLYITNIDAKIIAFASYIIAEITSYLIIFVFLTNQLKIKIKLKNPISKESLEDIKYLLKETYAVNASSIITIISKNIDSLIINYLFGLTLTGIYNIAYVFINPLITTFNAILPGLTIFTIEKRSKKREIKEVFNIIVKYALIGLLLVYSILLLYGNDILRIIFGKIYESAYEVLIILLTGHIVNLLSYYFVRISWAYENLKYLIKLYIVSSAINILLTLILTPSLGIIGASIATSISLIYAGLVHIMHSRKYIKLTLSVKSIFLAFILSVGSLYGVNYVVHIYIDYLTVPQAIAMLVVSILVYGTALFLFKVITIEEIRKILFFVRKTLLDII